MVWKTLARHLVSRPAPARVPDAALAASLGARLAAAAAVKLGRALAIGMWPPALAMAAKWSCARRRTWFMT